MDLEKTKKLFDELLKAHYKSETYGILFYSTDKTRDFAILDKKIEKYKERLSEAIDGITTTESQPIKQT